MKLYDIADLKVALDCQKRTMERAQKYLSEGTDSEPDIIIKTTPEEIAAINKPEWTEEVKAYVYEGQTFYCKLITDFNGMMIHSSAIVVDDKAYLFSAPSGTGKSTHTAFWLEKFGDRAYILNDDKPAVRILEDGVYAYGTPWSGKNDISVNKKIKVQAICFLERANENWIKPIDQKDIAVKMYNSTIRKLDMNQVEALFGIIEEIAKQVPIFRMGCTPTPDSAEMAYKAMSKANL